MSAGEADRARLRWRCRRGMKELDLLLVRWLELHYGSADAAQRDQFAALLDLPDPEIAAYLPRQAHPAELDLRRLVQQIAPTGGLSGGGREPSGNSQL